MLVSLRNDMKLELDAMKIDWVRLCSVHRHATMKLD